MSDASAAALAECLLADGPDRAVEPLQAALRVDPPLALWAVCAAGEEIEPRAGAAAGSSSAATACLCTSVDDTVGGANRGVLDSSGTPRSGRVGLLARWLAAGSLRLLAFETKPPERLVGESQEPRADDSIAGSTGSSSLVPRLPKTLNRGGEPVRASEEGVCLEMPEGPTEDPSAGRWATVVERAVQTAALAEWLARGDGPAVAEEAYLLGLVRDPAPWFVGPPDDLLRGLDNLLPRWLAEARESIAGRWARQAVDALAGGPADVPEETLQVCRRRAAEAKEAWLRSVPGAGRALVVLTARLRRLADLETRFEQTLEAEKLAAMAEFAAGAGHEINNPLAVIAGRAQLFLQDETDPERRRGLALINAQAKRVWEMIADMRLFARPPRPRFEPTDLVKLVDDLIEELASEAASRATSLCRAGATGPLVAEVDPAQLHVALGAVCRNAMEAIGRDGHVQIELAEAGAEVLLRVLDDGPGIAPEVRRHLFDPYYSARQAGRGLGLGLSKCWRIVVTNHRGRIDVASGPGQPTLFTIALPRRQGGPSTP